MLFEWTEPLDEALPMAMPAMAGCAEDGVEPEAGDAEAAAVAMG